MSRYKLLHFPKTKSGFIEIGVTTVVAGPRGAAYIANYAAIVADQCRDAFKSDADADRAIEILTKAIHEINAMDPKAKKTPKPKKAKIISDKEAEVFLDLAKDISGGWGLWGHEFMTRRSCQLKAAKAWVTKLRRDGMADVDILFYGDWKDGRHTADQFYARDSIAKLMDEIYVRDDDVEAVRIENESNYDRYAEMKEKLAKALGASQSKRYVC